MKDAFGFWNVNGQKKVKTKVPRKPPTRDTHSLRVEGRSVWFLMVPRIRGPLLPKGQGLPLSRFLSLLQHKLSRSSVGWATWNVSSPHLPRALCFLSNYIISNISLNWKIKYYLFIYLIQFTLIKLILIVRLHSFLINNVIYMFNKAYDSSSIQIRGKIIILLLLILTILPHCFKKFSSFHSQFELENLISPFSHCTFIWKYMLDLIY